MSTKSEVVIIESAKKKLSTIRSSGVSIVQGVAEVNVRPVGTFRIVHYIVGVH